MAGAMLALAVGAEPGHQVQRPAGKVTLPAPARVQPAVAALQIDHPAGMQGLAWAVGGIGRYWRTARWPA